MCVRPSHLPEIGPVACRNCWQCRKNRINDYVGRCLAEQKFSDKALAVTLTYADSDSANSSILTYSDFQKFMKRLRKAGYKVRYIVAGEYGSKKGRAHWHAILFFTGKYPEVENDIRINWDFWEHGFSYFQEPDYGGFAYVLKYALKDLDAEIHRGHLAMSKKPLLGFAYLDDLAQQYVKQGLSPQSLFYSFGDVFDAKQNRRKFYIQGASRKYFLESYLSQWEAQYEREHPFSELIEEYADSQIRLIDGETVDDMRARIHGQTVEYVPAWKAYGEYRGIPITIETNKTKTVYFFYTEGSGRWLETRHERVLHLLNEITDQNWHQLEM